MQRLIELIARLILAIFKKPETEPEPVEPEPLVLPHPENAPDYTATMDNVDINTIISTWFDEYAVQNAHRPYWLNDCNIILSQKFTYPAATIAQTKTVYVRPEWCNPGVIAHEVCHIVWYELTETERIGYENALYDARQTDELVKLAWETKTYMQTNIVEAHADCYRYLGQYMPDSLKKYYPRLF